MHEIVKEGGSIVDIMGGELFNSWQTFNGKILATQAVNCMKSTESLSLRISKHASIMLTSFLQEYCYLGVKYL